MDEYLDIDMSSDNVEDSTNEQFINNMNSILAVKRNYEKKIYDYKWLEIIEETLPYLDNILRNPKRFIINEEEIVKVELARRVTVESVIHLTQHTNLIQDIDEKNGDVKPSKILNINKEESLDTYENRFIYTLINNLIQFYETRKEATGDNSYYSDKKSLKYEANTEVESEKVSVSLTINSLDKNIIPTDKGRSQLTLDERYKKVKTQIDGFRGSEMYQTLSRLHVPPVRSPIRKTNVILKNPNFKKAEELWNFIQSYEEKNKNEIDNQDYLDTSELKKEYDQAILMAYIANKSLSNKKEALSDRKVITQMINRLIETVIDGEEDINEDKLKEIFNKQLKYVKERNIYKRSIIINTFNDRLTKENNKYNDALLMLERNL